MPTPNIIYIHSHDTGRYIQPYGHPVATPHLQQLAEEGVLFRQAFCAAPTCSPSRSVLLTGQYAHNNGMFGLAHRGFSLRDYGLHLIHTLKSVGYVAALAGIQHVAAAAETIGYDQLLGEHEGYNPQEKAVEFLNNPPPQPFFLSVGFFDTHREFPSDHDINPDYCQPPAPLPDTPAVRQDVADYKASARRLDDGVGQILATLRTTGLLEHSIVIYTTDHGIAFPFMKCNLTDDGIGVSLIMRGGDDFRGGKVIEGMVSHIDIFPTLCDVLGVEAPPHLQGHSLLPLIRNETTTIRDEVFAEVSYHAAYEPKRAIRTARYKYIRRFDNRESHVLPNIDDSPSKSVLLAQGLAEQPVARESLFDLTFDPTERNNLATNPGYAHILAEMRRRLERWMQETDDPLLAGNIPVPAGAVANNPDEVSPQTEPKPITTAD